LSSSFPLFVQSADGTWLQPIPFYVSSAFGPRAPFVVGVIDLILTSAAAPPQPQRRRGGAPTAALLMFFPAHAIFMGQSGDAIYPVAFVAAWLLCLLRFLDEPRPRWLLAGGLSLGLGVYTQPSAPISMTVFALISLAALWLDGHRRPRLWAALLAGFALPLLLMVPWFARHPETYNDTMGAWAIQKAHIRFPLDGVRAFLNWNTLGTRVGIYWETFNPSFLLFRANDGVFAQMAPMTLSVAVLALAGIRAVLTRYRSSVAFLLLAGLAATPLAASTFGARHPIDRALPMVLFLSLLAGVGLDRWLQSPRRDVRLVAFVLAALIPIEYWFG
jgi:4-amino-4-deoxy-L-arabinose transferase-like glycosyltransferase